MQDMVLQWNENLRTCIDAATRGSPCPSPEAENMVDPVVDAFTVPLVQQTDTPNAKVPASKQKKRRAKKKKSLAAQVAEAARAEPLVSAQTDGKSWAAVTKRSAVRRDPHSSAKKTTPKSLTVPRTSAVVLSLRPEAANTGMN